MWKYALNPKHIWLSKFENLVGAQAYILLVVHPSLTLGTHTSMNILHLFLFLLFVSGHRSSTNPKNKAKYSQPKQNTSYSPAIRIKTSRLRHHNYAYCSPHNLLDLWQPPHNKEKTALHIKKKRSQQTHKNPQNLQHNRQQS